MWRSLPEKVLLCFGRFLDREFDQREARRIVIEGIVFAVEWREKTNLARGQENATEARLIISLNHLQ